ncbi:condensation domain-containing protein [Saccharothrix australiensis]|uniref:Condensation domain-containing protein n=1 Tax=Saccharothrix australiensis TaxID=2072 RepID=A0A495WAN1_9PSEU|nr:condensation domain-containing protein [Saccharothrix australiensis]RKT57783.1 condensation domain-containing protein [Saccharothrix australiensis]
MTHRVVEALHDEEEIPPSPVLAGVPFRAGVDDEAWFLASREDGRPTLASQSWWDLPASADTALLLKAVGVVAAGHDVLTSRFAYDGDRVVCIPGSAGPALLELRRSGGSWTAPAIESDIDPLAGPVVRALVERHDSGVRFGLQVSHAVVDGWSWKLLLDELADTYDLLAAGHEARPLPAPQMRDWAAAQHALLAATGDDRVRRWEALLAGAGLEPVDVDRLTGSWSGELGWEAPASRWDSVVDAAKRLRVSPLTLLAGLLARTLSAVRGRPGAIRIPFLNRDLPGSTEIIGNLSSQLLVPFPDVSALTDEQVVEAVRDTVLEGVSCAPVPYDQALTGLWGPRQAAHVHLWAPFLSLQDEDEEPLLAGGHVTEVVSPADEQDGCEVTIEHDEDELRISAAWRGVSERAAQDFIRTFELFVLSVIDLDGGRAGVSP